MNVLTVMGRAVRLAMYDRAQRGSAPGAHNDAAEYSEAREAVAELIEATKQYQAAHETGGSGVRHLQARADAATRLRAALARVGGAA